MAKKMEWIEMYLDIISILGSSVGIECYGCDGSTSPCDATHHGYVFYCSNTDYCELIYAGNS